MAVSENHGRVMRQSAVILTSGWLLAPLQFLTAIIVARIVGPEGKGALALLTGVTAILVGLIGLGIPSGAAVLYPQGADARRAVIGTSLVLTSAACLLLLLAYLAGGPMLLLALLSERDLANLDPAWILLALAAVAPAALAAIADVILIAANAMRTFAVRAAASGVLGLALTWLLTVHLGWGVTGALASYPLASTFGLVLFGHWWWHQKDLRPSQVTVACARSLLRVGVQQHAIGIIALVAKRVDVFLVASLLTLQDAGFYAAGILIPQAVISIPRATMWPLVSSLSSQDGGSLEAVARVSRVQVLLMALMSLALLLLAPLVVRVLFGEVFSPSIRPFRWALAGLLFTPVTITVNAILTARERPGLSILSALAGTGVQLALTILLIPRWGAAAAAAALSANFMVTAFVQLALVQAQGVPAGSLLIPTRKDVVSLLRALRARVRA